MATANGIHNIISPYPMGDVEKYFIKLDRTMGMNSGVNDYSCITHNCYATSTPFAANCFSKFKLTDQQFDIIDISQGYIHLNVNFDLEFDHKVNQKSHLATMRRNFCWFFVGLKSGAQIIDTYKVYSNGRLTACNQVKANHEQAIVFNCKSKDQKYGRPGVYSCHDNVLKMNDCVCGFYIKQPLGMYMGNKTELNCSMEIVIQIDDLLPFSGMRYFPAFACGDLELELSFTLEKNFVFCQIPFTAVAEKYFYKSYDMNASERIFRLRQGGYAYTNEDFEDVCASGGFDTDAEIYIDSRFHQCGDYARCFLGLTLDDSTKKVDQAIEESYLAPEYTPKPTAIPTGGLFNSTWVLTYMTIIPRNLLVNDAKSFIYGFNIKPETKQNIISIFKQEKQ